MMIRSLVSAALLVLGLESSDQLLAQGVCDVELLPSLFDGRRFSSATGTVADCNVADAISTETNSEFLLPDLKARNISVARLFQACISKQIIDQVQCLIFVMGTAEGYQLGSLPKAPKMCQPPGTTNDEVMARFRSFVVNHPEFNQLPASMGLMAAIGERWKCTE